MPSFSKKLTGLLRFSMWCSAKNSRHVITDSEWSRRDILDIYGLPEKRVSVVYLGYDRGLFNSAPANPEKQQDILLRFGITKPYIFHHGVVQPRKNLKRLIAAFRMLKQSNRNLDLQLVLAGPLGWRFAEVVEAANSGGPEKDIIFTHSLPDSDLALLLKGAVLTVIPSLYEGFCLPMVESMASGVPTVTSNTSCLPEVSGGDLRYFDPLSVEDMKETMQSVLEDSSIQSSLIRAGLERASRFSWETCARETLQILIKSASSS